MNFSGKRGDSATENPFGGFPLSPQAARQRTPADGEPANHQTVRPERGHSPYYFRAGELVSNRLHLRFEGLPVAGWLAGAAHIAGSKVQKWTQARDRIQALRQRGQSPSLYRNRLPVRDQFEVRSERVKAEDFMRRLTARRHAIPPDERTAAFYLDASGLVVAGTGKRDQLIGQVFQVRVPCNADVHALRCPAFRRAAAIHASGAGGRYLRLRARPHVHLPGKRI